MKNEKRIFKTFRYRECEAFAEYLRKQSQQGWHFKEWSLGMIFEKGEPKDVIYDVEVFPKGSEMDQQPEGDAMEFADYCEAAGWQLLDGKQKFCIFRREKEDAVPIVTAQERLQNVWKAEWRRFLWQIVPLMIITVEEWISVTRYSAEMLLSNMMVFLLAGITLLVSLCLIDGVNLIIWKISAQRRLKNGRTVNYKKRFAPESVLRGFFIIGILIVGYLERDTVNLTAVIITLIVCTLFVVLLEIWRPTRGENWLAQIFGGIVLVFIGTIIFAVSILSGETEKTTVNSNERIQVPWENGQTESRAILKESESVGSILVKKWAYSVEITTDGTDEKESRYETQNISYQIYESKYNWVLDIFWENMKRRAYFTNPEDCTEQWSAQTAFCEEKNMGTYVVKYPDKVVVLYASPILEKQEILHMRKMFLEFREG